MSRTNWLLGTLLLGAVFACGGNGATSNGDGNGVDASVGAGASGSSSGSVADASGADVGVTPIVDGGGGADATSSSGSVGVDGGAAFATPPTLEFGLVNCGSTAPAQTFTVVNPSMRAVTWSATLGQGTASSFTIAPTGGSLASGQSVQVTVTPNAVPATASTSTNALADIVTVSLGSSSTTVALNQTAQGAVLAFEPASVGFGSVPLAAGPQSLYFAVQNSGNLQASVTLTLTGDPSFTLPGQSTTQTLTATSGNVVDSQVTYAPTAVSTVTGSVALTLNGAIALCGPLPTALPVSGTGSNGQVAVTPAQVVFGNGGFVPCGTAAAPATISLENTGSGLYTWTAVLTHGSSFYTLNVASGTVTAGSTGFITVTPKTIPTASATTGGEYDDTLTITTSVVGDSPHVVTLQETAQGAIITRTSSGLAFGSVGLDAMISNSTTVSFMNTGNVSASLNLANGNSAFIQGTPGVPFTVGAGAFVPEIVTFNPTVLGAYTDLGTVTLDAEEDGGTVPLCATLPPSLTLSGTGVITSLTSSPSSLNFGYLPCLQTGTQPLTVTISNNGPATKYTASVLKGAASYFAVSPATASGSLPAGGTAPVTISVLPLPQGPTSTNYSDIMQLVTELGNIVNVNLSQTALSAILAFNHASIAFTSAVTSGTSATNTTLTLTNNGTSPATVTLTPSSPYAVTPPTATIPAGGSVPYTITFSPPSPGPYPGTLAVSVTNTIDSCANPNLPASVTLSGTGN